MANDPGKPTRTAAIVSADQPHGGADARRMAHELSNLLDGSLRNISLAIDRLKRETPVPTAALSTPVAGGDLVRRLETASHGLRQMAVLVRQMMDERPAAAPQRQSAHEALGPAIGRTLDLVAPLAAEHGVVIEAACDDEAATLPAGRLPHVVENAVRNSIEMIAASDLGGGVVCVEVCAADGTCELSIADDGPGFDVSLFDRQGGYRFGRTTRPDGHGIGLTVARDVAAQLHGVLDLFNRPQGGAVVRLRYPIAPRGEASSVRIVPVR